MYIHFTPFHDGKDSTISCQRYKQNLAHGQCDSNGERSAKHEQLSVTGYTY